MDSVFSVLSMMPGSAQVLGNCLIDNRIELLPPGRTQSLMTLCRRGKERQERVYTSLEECRKGREREGSKFIKIV